MTSNQATNVHDNNFDLLRLIAALCVLVSHSFGILNKGLEQPIIWKGESQIILSEIGLGIFFSISGYLIVQSLLNSDSYKHYWWKRLIRIMPALVVSNLVCIAIGATVTTVPVSDYLLSGETWLYFIKNSLLVVNQFTLPGVFVSLKDTSVNASIWTIFLEVECYFLLMIASLVHLLDRKWVLFTGFIFFIALRIITTVVYPVQVRFIDLNALMTYGTYFYAGVLYYRFKEDLPLSWWYANIFLAIAFVTAHSIFQPITFALFLAYATLILGNSKAIINLKGTDISYGFYLYAFPIQQLVLLFFGYGTNPWIHILISGLFAAIAGFISWTLVEKGFLRKKNFRRFY